MSNPSQISDEPITVEHLLKLANTIDLFEQYTRPHASQLARLAEALALRVGVSTADLNALKIAALLHDVGEMIMDSPILRKAGIIDFKHRIELWRHPIIGEQQLAKRQLPKQAQLLVRWHHEWWNGSGYPDMLSKEMIPIGARILRLVDSYDALTAYRPYREAFSIKEAQDIIERSAGIEFDPYLVKVFLEMLREHSTLITPKISQTLATKPTYQMTEPTKLTEDTELYETSETDETDETDETVQEMNSNENNESLVTENQPENYSKLLIPDNNSDNDLDNDLEDPNISVEVSKPIESLNSQKGSLEEYPLPNSDLINSSEEIVNKDLIESVEEDVTESKPDLGTQPLFLPSNNLMTVSNTSYLLENNFAESKTEKLENVNKLLTQSEENFLDKSKENVENKSE
ncbi:MAG: HD domain-containing protein [Acidobacteria bacterium]|nr:HD domain-containing protein [Acidobacteriota bacterium]